MNFEDFIRIIPKIKETEIDSNISHLKMAPPFRKHLLELTKTNYYNSKKAGVTILFHPNNDKVYFTLILRNKYKGVHSNQIGLPGGRFENGDKDIFQTALRETNEEIGVHSKKITLIKKLNNVYVPPSNYDIFPFMVYTADKANFIIDKNEVQGVINIEIDQLINSKIVKRKGSQISNRQIDVLVPAYRFSGHYVWGATAMILSEVKDIFTSVL